MTFIWVISAGLGLFLLYILNEIRKVGTPTTGAQIDLAARPGTALIVIDMQSDFTSVPAWDQDDLDNAMARIGAASKAARDVGFPVVAIRQVFRGRLATLLNGWFNQGRGNEGSDGSGLDPRLELNPNAEFVKSVGDAFSSSDFEAFLAQNQIGTVILSGLDGCHCVHKTALGALNRGYRVRIDTAAILAADPARWTKIKTELAAGGAEIQD